MSGEEETSKKDGLGKAIGLGIITGAADDHPSAIGNYARRGESERRSFCSRRSAPLMFTWSPGLQLGQVSDAACFTSFTISIRAAAGAVQVS